MVYLLAPEPYASDMAVCKTLFLLPPFFSVFFFREQISMVTGLISTAWALEIPLFLKSSGGSKGIKPFPFSSLMHANMQSVSTEVVRPSGRVLH